MDGVVGWHAGHGPGIADDARRRVVVAVHQDDVFQGGKLFPDTGDFPVEAFPGDDADRPGISEAVQKRVFPEVGKEGAADCSGFEDAEENKELLRHFGEKGEENVSAADAEGREEIREAVAFRFQIVEGIFPAVAVGIDPAHGSLVRQPLPTLLRRTRGRYVHEFTTHTVIFLSRMSRGSQYEFKADCRPPRSCFGTLRRSRTRGGRKASR